MKTPDTPIEILNHHFGNDFFSDEIKVLIANSMQYYAGKKINEQREIMARCLNLRNVPRPKGINEDD